jgi:hypothetical protein
MKLRSLALVPLLLLSVPTLAEIPGMEAQGLLARTNPEVVRVSPLWGMVALHSGVLQNLRFHGHYGAQPDPRFPGHLDLADAPDCPRDAVAGVLQHLFPCPDGVNFVHNERDKDPIGLIAQEQREDRKKRHAGSRPGGLGKILALLDATLDYQRILAQSPHGGHPAADANFQAAVYRILDRRSKSADLDPPASHFNVLRKNFASLMQQAVLEEARDTQGRYPPDTVPVALLAYAWKAANHVEELYEAFQGHLLEGAEPKEPYTARRYREDWPRFQKRQAASLKGAALDAEDLALNLFGQKAYEGAIPELVPYGTAVYSKLAYPDCGETTLRNFFNIAFSDGGALDPRRIDTFCAQFTDPEGALAGLRDFYRNYPTRVGQATDAARNAWSALLSDLNQTADPLPITYAIEDCCNLMGTGLENMLNLIAHLLPDEVLNQDWPQADPDRSNLAAKKLDRLCALTSRPGFQFTWAGPVVGDGEVPPEAFPTLVFAIEGEPAFNWHFMPRHFSLSPHVQSDPRRWPSGMRFEPAHPWLQLWLRGAQHVWDQGAAPHHAYEIYANNLRDPEEVLSVLESVLFSPPGPAWGAVGQLVGHCLPLDPHVFEEAIGLLHGRAGFQEDPRFYPVPALKAWPQDCKDQMLMKTFHSGLPPKQFYRQVRFWLDHGAGLGARDADGRNALELAEYLFLTEASGILAPLAKGEAKTL